MILEPIASDEEVLAHHLPGRREHGRYFTPAALANFVVQRASALVPPCSMAVVDPACGAGALLAAARQRWPEAALFGLELSREAAALCQARVPQAWVRKGDAFRGGLLPLLENVPKDAFELWIGNPPYNGTSAVLRDKQTYGALQHLLPAELPKGTSLRDDFAFFLLLARQRLAGRAGALAFITSASLVDAFLYQPLRRALLDTFALREVIELGAGAFAQTRVRTCVTLWTTDKRPRAAHHRSRGISGPFEPEQLGGAHSFIPAAPGWLLRPSSDEARALDETWRQRGEPLSVLVPIAFPGLKTRFDELLVDDDERLLARRMRAFFACRSGGVRAFAAAWGIPRRCATKLAALQRAARLTGTAYDAQCIRPFFRHPHSPRAFCYLDRRLIPRGDHRFRGPYDPHACSTKLVFNTRELPLSSAVLAQPGCVHAHRHARFAPLEVPERLWKEGLGAARRGELGPDVVNLSERGRAWAQRLGGPAAAFGAIARFINSDAVQNVWAPAYGASRELCVPLDADGVTLGG